MNSIEEELRERLTDYGTSGDGLIFLAKKIDEIFRRLQGLESDMQALSRG